jgi:8-oxo-dGTP pyrophosphatase MutT (NUDIX family)
VSSSGKKIQELNAYLVPMHSGKVLLLRRRHTEFWEFPGGGVDWGEEPSYSAKRELKEETGLDVSEVKFVGITSATYEKEGKMKHSVYLVYKGDVASEDFSLGLEHEEGRWVSLDEAKFMKLALNCEDIPSML